MRLSVCGGGVIRPRDMLLCDHAAQHLASAGYHVPAHMLRNWEPWSLEPQRLQEQRRNALNGWLSYVEGLLECAKRHAPHEVEHLEQAYDAIERELDALDREVRRAG